MSIFRHTDRDGDELEVHIIGEDDRDYPGTLMFGNTGRLDDTGTMISSSLDRDAVLRLHAALGEWLYPVHTPEWANRSLIEQMIERAVKDQVAAVLPLHLKPFATQMQAAEDKIERVANAVLTDPEPHDVGHAEGPEGVHRPQDCPGQPECAEGESKPDALFAPGARAYYREVLGLEPEPTDHGRLMSELPRRMRPRPICVSCGHGWGEHTGGICWGRGTEKPESGCTCTRERPGTTGTP